MPRSGLLLASLVVACNGPHSGARGDASATAAPVAPAPPSAPLNVTGARIVSLSALLAVPERWDHVRVEVQGYLPKDPSDLCLTREHFDRAVVSECLDINPGRCDPEATFPPKLQQQLAEWPGDYAHVEGMFVSAPSGEYGMSWGKICEISDIRPHRYMGEPAGSASAHPNGSAGTP